MSDIDMIEGFWKVLMVLFLLAIVIAGIIYYVTRPNYPTIVNIYKYRYDQMSTLENREELINYTKFTLNDSIEGLDYLGLLEWEHRYLKYTSGYLPLPRPELPIPIIELGLGRCGEFALLYTGLLLANEIECRLIVDCSTPSPPNGDHVWVEIWDSRLGDWLHIDPTEKIINQPDMYAVKWNKNVNRIYAITAEEIIDVTDNYCF